MDIGKFIVLNILIERFFITMVNKKFYFRVYISDLLDEMIYGSTKKKGKKMMLFRHRIITRYQV